MLDINELKQTVADSPAMVFDLGEISRVLACLTALKAASGCQVLYSVKALPLLALLQWIKPHVDGFSASSLFEARWVKEMLSGLDGIHLTTPGARPDEAGELSRICSHISANSLNQFRVFQSQTERAASLGLRINPELSFSNDARFDPCRPFSKLGVTLAELDRFETLQQIEGLHFHTVFSAEDYQPLLATLAKITPWLKSESLSLKWLNLGGGYCYGNIDDHQPLIEAVRRIVDRHKLTVYVEPGNAVVRAAGYLLATVLDVFERGGKTVAVLDTSVNHLPEVFEYQRPPMLAEHDPEGDCPVILAGSTCLAGDVFGEFRLRKPLAIGDKVVFRHVGAYTLVKAQRFNGYNLPTIYLHKAGEYRLVKRYAYEDFRQFWLSDTGFAKD
jgi:carboxynorspermidine decarboxylase